MCFLHDADLLFPAFQCWQEGTYQQAAVYCGDFPGMEALVELIGRFSFDLETIQYLGATQRFNESFLNYLQRFSFSFDLDYRQSEEPAVCIRGPLIQILLLKPALERQFGSRLEECDPDDVFLTPLFRAGKFVYETP